MRLNAKELRVTKPEESQRTSRYNNPIVLILDNVLDTYNIGSLFRLADAVAVEEVVLCGGTERPPSSRIHKAAVGTEEWVPWRYFSTAQEAISDLRSMNKDLRVITVEQDKRAKSLFNLTPDHLLNAKASLCISRAGGGNGIAVVVGHETEGVSREVLDMADVIVEIPMWGVNKSLNVHVSAAIVLYKLLESS